MVGISSKIYYPAAKRAPYFQTSGKEEDDGSQEAPDATKSGVAARQEADAAAGGAFQKRVGSFSLLPRSTSMDTVQIRNISRYSTADDDASKRGTPSRFRGAGQQQQQQQQRHGQRSRESSLAVKIPLDITPPEPIKPDWRLRDRMRTVGVGLVVALNIGTPPPDVVKPHPCAVLQCWMDPTSVSRSKAKEIIGEKLEQQYAQWQLAKVRATRPLKYRRALDPTVEDVRNLCVRLRRDARQERILLHYNGHGVPRPTDHGEIWVFDKNHTEYIPLAIADLKQWMGKPTIVVMDCSSAGVLIPFFTQTVDEQSEVGNNNNDNGQQSGDNIAPAGNSPGDVSPSPRSTASPRSKEDDEEQASKWVRDTIVLCPCSENEWLPMNPDYPGKFSNRRLQNV
jgi:hypothetical protein